MELFAPKDQNLPNESILSPQTAPSTHYLGIIGVHFSPRVT